MEDVDRALTNRLLTITYVNTTLKTSSQTLLALSLKGPKVRILLPTTPQITLGMDMDTSAIFAERFTAPFSI